MAHRVRRQSNDRRETPGAPVTFENPACGFPAVHLGHLEFHQYQVECFGCRPFHREPSILNRHHRVAALPQQRARSKISTERTQNSAQTE
jgi:hypothetical protein